VRQKIQILFIADDVAVLRAGARRNRWPADRRHKWGVASDLLFTASSANAVGVESVLAQKVQPVGTHDTVGVRLGSELETVPGRLRLRLGSYYEPSNYAGVSSRMHVTGGFAVRVFHTSIWGDYDWALTATVDSRATT
jgi:hypothetical protein